MVCDVTQTNIEDTSQKQKKIYTEEESNVLICDVTHTNVEDPPQMHKIIIIVKKSQMFGYVI